MLPAPQVRVRAQDNSNAWTAFTSQYGIATAPALASTLSAQALDDVLIVYLWADCFCTAFQVSQRSTVVTGTLASGSGSATIDSFRCATNEAMTQHAVASGSSTLSVTLTGLARCVLSRCCSLLTGVCVQVHELHHVLRSAQCACHEHVGSCGICSSQDTARPPGQGVHLQSPPPLHALKRALNVDVCCRLHRRPSTT